LKIYLASPYSGTPEEQEYRFRAVSRIAGQFIQEGHIVYSPISHSHPIAQECPRLGSDWQAWERMDREFIAWCDELWVLKLPGWDNSKGIGEEVMFATEIRKSIRFIEAS